MRPACAALTTCLIAAGCGSGNTTQPTPLTRDSQITPQSGSTQRIALGDEVAVSLSGAFVSGGLYCEIGNDPFPCAWFVVDIPRAATVVIRMESATADPMFIQVGNLAIADHLTFVAGPPPLVARLSVPAGELPFRAGLNMPWGRSGSVLNFRLVATLE